MKIDELEISVKGKGVDLAYNETLNPQLWEENQLKSEVAEQLMLIGKQFIEYLEIPDSVVKDYVITGSNASYNWSDYSDLDLHILLDVEGLKTEAGSFVDGYLQSKRKIWTDEHDINIYGINIECYPQDVSEEHHSSGMYSVLNAEWVKVPEYKPFDYNGAEVQSKVDDIVNQIDEVLQDGCGNHTKIKILSDKIMNMRKCGLAREGEGSVENLTFKVLRASGYIAKLFACKTDAFDKNLSL